MLTLDGENSRLRTGPTNTSITAGLALTNGAYILLQNQGVSLSGTLSMAGDGRVVNGTAQQRTLVLNSLISGSGTLTFDLKPTDVITLTNGENTFSGRFDLRGTAESTLLHSAVPGSLGIGSSIVLSMGSFQADHPLEADGKHSLLMNSSSIFILENWNHTFSVVRLGKTALAAGTYSISELNAFNAGTFVGDSGTITVLP